MKKVKALVFYPWPAEAKTGSRQVLLSYARAMRNIGLCLDLFAPTGDPHSRESDFELTELFDQFFIPPCLNDPIRNVLAGVDPMLGMSERLTEGERAMNFGINSAAILAAGALLSISDYAILAIHYTICHRLKDFAPSHVKKILFVHDIDSLVERDSALLLGRNCSLSLDHELAAMKGFDLVTVFGDDDKKIILDRSPDLPVLVAPFCGKERAAVEIVSGRSHVLWLSSAAEFNRVSFEWFVHNVWPSILSAVPKAQLIVAGRICEYAETLDMDGDMRMNLLGIVDDIEDLHHDADVLVAPYLFGDGIKTRIVDGLAFGIPIVTTMKGLTNLPAEPGVHLMVADEAEEFSAITIRLLRDMPERLRLSEAARLFIANHCSPETGLREFRTSIRNLCPKPLGPIDVVQRVYALPVQVDVEKRLKERVPSVLRRCEVLNISKIAIYGAGGHTRVLLPLIQEFGRPKVTQILTTTDPVMASLEGIQVKKINDFDSESIEAVLISSHSYEYEMRWNCLRLFPELLVLTIWA